MRICGVMLVRNEEDVLEASVRHNLGVLDSLTVVDHASTDASPAILASLAAEGLPLEVLRDDSPGFRQSDVTTDARAAAPGRGRRSVHPGRRRRVHPHAVARRLRAHRGGGRPDAASRDALAHLPPGLRRAGRHRRAVAPREAQADRAARPVQGRRAQAPDRHAGRGRLARQPQGQSAGRPAGQSARDRARRHRRDRARSGPRRRAVHREGDDRLPVATPRRASGCPDVLPFPPGVRVDHGGEAAVARTARVDRRELQRPPDRCIDPATIAWIDDPFLADIHLRYTPARKPSPLAQVLAFGERVAAEVARTTGGM